MKPEDLAASLARLSLDPKPSMEVKPEDHHHEADHEDLEESKHEEADFTTPHATQKP
jgi:hypothetical protein